MKFFSAFTFFIFLSFAAFHCKESAVVDPRDLLAGSYEMVQVCDDQPSDTLGYQVMLSKSNDFPNRMIADNFGGYGVGNFVFIEVAQDQTFVLFSQEISVGLLGNATVEGTGNWQENVLLFNFNVFISGIVDTQCQSQGFKL